MAGWQLESFKMLTYLLFPVGAFIFFNHPAFYERAVRQTLESTAADINFEQLSQLESMSLSKGLNKLDSTIEELDTQGKTK